MFVLAVAELNADKLIIEFAAPGTGLSILGNDVRLAHFDVVDAFDG